MTKALRRRPKRGRYLSPVPAAHVVEAGGAFCATWDQAMVAAGYTRCATVRPYLAMNGLVTFKLVWRKREDGHTATADFTIRLPLQELLKAYDDDRR